MAALLASCGHGGGGSAASAGSVPRLDHVVVIVMENKSYDIARSAPYTASLVVSGASFSNYYAVAHPSQPNYLALWSGSTQGVTTDACPPTGAPYRGSYLGAAAEAAGLTWRAYSEDLPSAGSAVCSANNGLYLRRHEPWTQFGNVNHANEQPYSALVSDIAGGRLPNLAFVVPNACNDTHTCSVAQGDQWLADHVPSLLAAVGPNGVVIVTWDEDDQRAGNHVLMVIAGNPVRAGAVSHRSVNHYTLSRTIAALLGIGASGDAARQQPISDVWAAGAAVRTGIVAPER